MKIKDASWIIPLLQAAADGKTLQYRVNDGEWADISPNSHISFLNLTETYRIKPDSIRFRNYLWHHMEEIEGPVVLAVTEEDNSSSPRENWTGFIRWLGDWQEVEVGQLNG